MSQLLECIVWLIISSQVVVLIKLFISYRKSGLTFLAWCREPYKPDRFDA